MELLEGQTLRHQINGKPLANRNGARSGHPDRRCPRRGTFETGGCEEYFCPPLVRDRRSQNTARRLVPLDSQAR
jgi:hypothetical protein